MQIINSTLLPSDFGEFVSLITCLIQLFVTTSPSLLKGLTLLPW
jgi:hypothetical protein